jgi:hypothetical protein
MSKKLWFQTNLNNDGGPICRALRYRDDEKDLSEFVATLQPTGVLRVHTYLNVEELFEITRQFNEVIYQFRDVHRLLEEKS